MKEKIKKIIFFLANPRFILCFGIAWLITNGWSYILLALGTWLGITWMQVVASSYLALLWVPFTPEKIITTAIAMVLLRFLFPHDQKTLAVLQDMYAKAKLAFQQWLKKVRQKKEKN